uniref:Maf-like protein n=1 Tax=Chloropicon laureae TaxID=464258 RepID=A0A7S3E1T7_9CHLO
MAQRWRPGARAGVGERVRRRVFGCEVGRFGRSGVERPASRLKRAKVVLVCEASSGMLHLCRNELKQVKVVLASQSPRRQELMGSLGLTFETSVSTFDEDLDKSNYPEAADYAADTAFHKVQDVFTRITEDPSREQGDRYLVIGADTVVDLGGQVMEKPSDKQHAFEMLKQLSGNSHRVHTGVAVCHFEIPRRDGSDGKAVPLAFTKCSETTAVTFSDLPDEVIHAYIESGEPMDKAGSYGIQGAGGSMVSGIQGCYFNVMGLPLNRLSKVLIDLLKTN